MPPLFDTMLAAQLLNSSGGPSRVNLASLAQHYLGRELPKKEQKSDWNGITRTAPQNLKIYITGDAAIGSEQHELCFRFETRHEAQ
jgi:ribonuclease D